MNLNAMQRKKQRLGMTLIELLVCMAIILVLAGLVLPVFASARRSAKSASCISNLHQISVAAQMYESDNQGLLPPMNPRMDVYVGNGGAMSVKDPLYAYGTNSSIFHCPDYAGPSRQFSGMSDFDVRFGLLLVTTTTHKIEFWSIRPEPMTVILYCGWNRANAKLQVGGRDGKLGQNGFFNALREDGSVSKVATGAVTRRLDWSATAGDYEPGLSGYLLFPNEPFPPALTRIR
jgi:prepilin-type N-terminal cleavage/methylation domain-containing protein